jgi:hypothetical protein
MRRITISVALGAAVMASPVLAQSGTTDATRTVQRPQGGAEVEQHKMPARGTATPVVTTEKKSGKTSTQHKGGTLEKKGDRKGATVEKKGG